MFSSLINLVVPLNLCIFLVIAGFVLCLLHFKRSGLSLIFAGILWVLLWSLPITSIIFGGILENSYPYKDASQYPEAQAIVVLGGATANNRVNWFEPLEPATKIARVDTAAELYSAHKAPRILVSGGALSGDVSEARGMAARLKTLGVPAEDIILENESRTTHENAELTVQELRDHQIQSILLVTSALHMPRSMASFSKFGLDVTAAPNPPQITVPDDKDFSLYIPNERALAGSRSVLKEYVGVLVYWLRGWL
ncbi:membrane protein [Advenella kashmirensis W13003]|uniref:Membrane protein n=1 Tax=Advenella kashmirensis W13003 TaxID=1424334 RepID=V8QK56_9BURK|nr:YdcF family protein [Advenella kashmirensis]ETF00331.1 membrane protein [Advenella kashmirensis W13003]